MLRFSANLGFLWTDLRLPEAIDAAANAAKATGGEIIDKRPKYSTKKWASNIPIPNSTNGGAANVDNNK